jgi:uncharacterized cupin superfamily protein
MNPKPGVLLKAEQIRSQPEYEARHPLNPDSLAYFRSLSVPAGLERMGFHLGRLPSGKEPNEYHSHHYEEEFYYVVSGRGVILMDGVEHEIGPGDFMAFPSPSVPHVLRNPFPEDLVYLVGGERREFELADFPRHGKVLIKDRDIAYMVERDALKVIWRAEGVDLPGRDKPE